MELSWRHMQKMLGETLRWRNGSQFATGGGHGGECGFLLEIHAKNVEGDALQPRF